MDANKELQKLEDLHSMGFIMEDEYNKRKQELLDSLGVSNNTVPVQNTNKIVDTHVDILPVETPIIVPVVDHFEPLHHNEPIVHEPVVEPVVDPFQPLHQNEPYDNQNIMYENLPVTHNIEQHLIQTPVITTEMPDYNINITKKVYEEIKDPPIKRIKATVQPNEFPSEKAIIQRESYLLPKNAKDTIIGIRNTRSGNFQTCPMGPGTTIDNVLNALGVHHGYLTPVGNASERITSSTLNPGIYIVHDSHDYIHRGGYTLHHSVNFNEYSYDYRKLNTIPKAKKSEDKIEKFEPKPITCIDLIHRSHPSFNFTVNVNVGSSITRHTYVGIPFKKSSPS